ncbi:hypothetical protein QOT17_004743 [Balamuthia mandrillaris]
MEAQRRESEPWKEEEEGSGGVVRGWEALPWEVSYKVWAEYLDPRDLPQAALVCRSWHRCFSHDNNLWKAWYTLRYGRAGHCHFTRKEAEQEEEDYRALFRKNAETPSRNMKVVLLGSEQSLKSKLCEQLAFGSVQPGYIPTLFNVFMTVGVTPAAEKVKVYLWDTPSAPSYEPLRPLAYHNTDVVLLCYRTDSRKSQHGVTARWLPEASKRFQGAAIIVVALSRGASSSEASVTFSPAPTKYTLCPVVCNVGSGENVDQLLQLLVTTYYDQWKLSHPLSTKDSRLPLLKKKKSTIATEVVAEIEDSKRAANYDITLANGKKHSLAFIAHPKRCIREMTDLSISFITTVLKFYENNVTEKALKGLEEETVEYIKQVIDFMQSTILFSTDGIVDIAYKKLAEGNGIQWNKDPAMANLLIELLSFLLEFDLSSKAPNKLLNGMALSISGGVYGFPHQQQTKPGQEGHIGRVIPSPELIHQVMMQLADPMPLFSKFSGDGQHYSDKQRNLEKTVMAAVANFCLAALQQQTGRKAVYERAMTAAILYHNKFSGSYTFDVKRSPIQIEECLSALQTANQHKLLDVLLFSISKITWRAHCSSSVKALLLQHRSADDRQP